MKSDKINLDKNDKLSSKSNSNGLFVLILIVALIVLILNFPRIYNLVIKLRSEPKVENKVENKEVDSIEKEEEELTDEIVNQVSFPIMRPNNHFEKSYYQLDKFEINNMSNSDKLVNAYLAIDPIFIENDRFDAKYIGLRTKNLLGKNISYDLENFTVPDSISFESKNKPGTWIYDSSTNSFVYGGPTYDYSEYLYNDIKQLIKYERENDNVAIYYYIGFVKYNSSNYYIYSDSNYNNLLTSGNVNSTTDYDKIFKSLKDKKQIYKFTFSDSLCTYDDYCLVSGEWVSEL